MTLLLLHPKVAFRDCNHCQQVLYDEETGKPVTRGRGEQRREILRHRGCPPPCRTDKGCPKGTPEDPAELSEANFEALIHYRECRATGRFPDDPIVARNAAIIYEIEELIRGRRNDP